MAKAQSSPGRPSWIASLMLVALYAFSTAEAQGAWRDGRATFFADTWDAWQMSRGHCQYGYLSKNGCTGFDAAAVADHNWDYNSATSNCGICYEVQCVNGDVVDGYGERFDRNICYNEQMSVVVQVIDLCECNYAPNAVSNRRWCCGDAQHLDLTVFAFEKLMPKDKGVGKIRYREVPCNYDPAYPAPNILNPTQLNPNEQYRDSDPRPCPSGRTSSTGSRSRPRGRNPPKRNPSKKTPSGGSTNVSVGKWSINSWSGQGVNGRTATACGTLLPWGGFTFQGGLQRKSSLDVWVKKEWGNLPNVNFRVEGSGGCKSSKHITGLSQTGWNGEYVRVRVPLRSMGCGGVYKVILQNNIGNWGWQNICIDSARAS